MCDAAKTQIQVRTILVAIVDKHQTGFEPLISACVVVVCWMWVRHRKRSHAAHAFFTT